MEKWMLILLMIPSVVALEITFPYENSFEGSNPTNGLDWWGDCGGSGSVLSVGCYSGNCVKIIPPTETCAGGGYNGGTAALGNFDFPDTPTMNIRYLIKIGPSYHTSFYGEGRQNKHLIVHTASSTRYMVQLEPDDSNSFWTFGVMDQWHETYFDSGTTDALASDGYKTTTYGGQWVSIESEFDGNTHNLYIYSQDGVLDELYASTDDAAGGTITEIQKLGGYFNGAHHADPDTYIMIDELVIDESYIGPPDGFIGGGFCGDGTCDETCETCPTDCGSCPSVCPDGTCDADETCETCSADCGACPIDCVHEADLAVCDGCVDTNELSAYINQWKSGSVEMAELMEVIGLWKSGC